MPTEYKIKSLEEEIKFVKILVTDLIKMINLLDSKSRCQQKLINLLVNRLDSKQLYDEFNLPEISELLKKEGIELDV